MKQLYLLRHADAAARPPDGEDYDRPLTDLGREQARSVARKLADVGVRPHLFLASSAVRARETLEEVQPILNPDGAVSLDLRLYLASPPRILERLREAPPAMSSVMLIAHSPGLEEFARFLLSGEEDALRRIGRSMPVAGAIVFTIPLGGWKALDAGDVFLKGLFIP